jgi:hypothetical protein
VLRNKLYHIISSVATQTQVEKMNRLDKHENIVHLNDPQHLDQQNNNAEEEALQLRNTRLLTICITVSSTVVAICLIYVICIAVPNKTLHIFVNIFVNFVQCLLLPLLVICRSPNIRMYLAQIFK